MLDGPALDTQSPGAFAAVYRRFHRPVWRQLARSGVPLPAVDDALQDVFLVVHRRLPEFEGRSKLSTWIFEVTRRTALEYCRRRAPSPAQSSSGLPASRPCPAALLETREVLVQLQGWLDELDADKRQAFVLSVLEERSAAEIGDSLGVNINTVYARVRAARNHIAKRARRASNLDGMVSAYREGHSSRARRHAWTLLAAKLPAAPGVALGVTGLALAGAKGPWAVGVGIGLALTTAIVVATGPSKPDDSSPPTERTAVVETTLAAVDPAASRPAKAGVGAGASAAIVQALPPPTPIEAAPAPVTAEHNRVVRPPAPAPAPAAEPAAEPDRLAEQVAALDGARAAVRSGRLERGHRLLAQFRHSYPASPLSEDVLKLSLVVACKLGDEPKATKFRSALASRFGFEARACE